MFFSIVAKIGMLGMHGTKASNLAVSECDLLIAVGTRFSDRVLGNPAKFASKAKVLQFDVDPAEINKNIMTDHAIIGDVKEILSRINKVLEQKEHASWLEHVLEISNANPLKSWSMRNIYYRRCHTYVSSKS